MILLTPGPVQLSQRVRKALQGPDLSHRESEFFALQAEIRRDLLEIYGLPAERFAAVLLTGSGTAAMEAMVSSLVPRDGRVLILENGVYGERLAEIASIYQIEHLRLARPWTQPIDLSALGRHLAVAERLTHLAVVHHETTTGRLNNLAAIADRCREHRIALLVDAVSSFGAEALDFEAWGIAGCAGTANKCLHGIPGVSFVIVRRDALPPQGQPRRNLYLDLGCYARAQDGGATPYTQSVQAFYALAEALAELQEEGGRGSRHARYRALADQVRSGLTGLGIVPLLAEGASSVVLNAFYLPKGIEYSTFHDALKRRGFVIYAGQGELARRIFRISTMGAITPNDIAQFLSAVEAIMKEHGKHSSAVDAAAD
ncbi:MAG: 2-aminoethylphosphonate aminotransferase [Gammaproteobacteria bacterium]|nr:2-aminoethylphosphonate aminotransferase [Gammaproteobacteria bacterium]